MTEALKLTGLVYGNLTVLKKTGHDVNGKSQWLCKCTCGNFKVVRGADLKSGVKSCGCVTQQMQRQMRLRAAQRGRKRRRAFVFDED